MYSIVIIGGIVGVACLSYVIEVICDVACLVYNKIING